MANLEFLHDQQDKARGAARRLTTKEFRENLSDAVEFTLRTNTPLVVTSHGKDRAALISIENLRKLELLEKIGVLRALEQSDSPEKAILALRYITEGPLPPIERVGQPNRVVDIISGSLQVRLAENAADIDAAQALRYRIFYETLGVRPLPAMEQQHRDIDGLDQFCDHLLVLDHTRGGMPEAVVGTYRLMRREGAARGGAFYSAGEYDIAPLIAYPGEILELGRSCIDAGYRARPVMQLLWAGIAAYVSHYDIALMFGCASLPGTDPDALAAPLSYLYYHHLAPSALLARALPDRFVDMRRLNPGALDPMRTLAALPPLIKGYLRLGGFVGDGAVIDKQFNTTDVCIVIKTDLVAEKYARHYERQSAAT